MYPGLPSRMEKEIKQLWLHKVLGGNPERLEKFKVRIEDPPRDAKPWARYRVEDAEAVELAKVRRELGEDSLRGTLKQGAAYHEENARVGCTASMIDRVCSTIISNVSSEKLRGSGPSQPGSRTARSPPSRRAQWSR